MKHILNEEEAPGVPAAELPGAVEDKLAFKSRVVLLFGEITEGLALATCRRLIALSEESAAPITMLISSSGGHVESGDTIHDVIRFINAPVTTLGSGWVASAAVHIFLSPPKERRLCLPNTRFMIHQPSGGAGGRASDIAIQAKEIIRARERIAQVIAQQTGQPLERVRQDIDRDFWMSAQEATDYGIVSRVVNRRDEV